MQTLSDRIFQFRLDCNVKSPTAIAYRAVKAYAKKNKIDLTKTRESLIEEFKLLNIEASKLESKLINKNITTAYEVANRCIDIKEGKQNGNNCV